MAELGKAELMSSIFKPGLAEQAVMDAVHRMVRRHCDETGDTYNDIAMAMGAEWTGAKLSLMLNGHARLTVDCVQRLTRVLKRFEGLQALNLSCGARAALSAREVTVQRTTVMDGLAGVQEAAEAAKAIAEGDADGSWTEGEWQRAVSEVEDVLNKFTEVRRGLDEIKARRVK